MPATFSVSLSGAASRVEVTVCNRGFLAYDTAEEKILGPSPHHMCVVLMAAYSGGVDKKTAGPRRVEVQDRSKKEFSGREAIIDKCDGGSETYRLNFMSNTSPLISALETAPGVIIPLIREVPRQILKRRPSPAKWSAYEHAVHLSQSDAAFRARLDLILSEPEPFIRTIENSPEDEAGAMLEIDLNESLDRYLRERGSLVERLKQLTPEEWRKPAVHEAFDHYSVFIMFRHLLNHEMLHAYRIEELLLKKDWN